MKEKQPNPDMVKVIVDELEKFIESDEFLEYQDYMAGYSSNEHIKINRIPEDFATNLLAKLNMLDRLDDTFLSGKMYRKEAMDDICNTQGGKDAE